ncbi:MAG: hypothetical protein KJ622_04220, partial [Alphaproteobacteria bacterium]|nr:hypothetical protein [Alphaproteobacteria bacterium]
LPRGESGTGRSSVVSTQRPVDRVLADRARDRHPHGPRPAVAGLGRADPRLRRRRRRGAAR